MGIPYTIQHNMFKTKIHWHCVIGTFNIMQEK
jgi:hypothetical protein